MELGSDVPLFLGPGAARMTGRGERVEATEVWPFVAVLYLPDCPCSTAEVYAAFDAAGGAAGCPNWSDRPFPPAMLSQPPSAWREGLRNHLAGPATRVRPELEGILRRLARAANLPVCVTGSGSAMFIACDDAAEAGETLARLPGELARRCVLVRRNSW